MTIKKMPIVELSSSIEEWLKTGGDFPEFIEISSNRNGKRKYEILDRDVNGSIPDVFNRKGHKGFVIRVREPSTQRIYAAKICLEADYSPEDLEHQIELASRLSTNDAIVIHDDVGTINKFSGMPDDTPQTWICFISRWLEGNTVQQILDDNDFERITPSWITAVIKEMVSVVLFMEQKGVKHDDLHLKNIILEPTDPDLRIVDPSIPIEHLRIIDLGSLKEKNQATSKAYDDWLYIVKCILQLHNALFRNRKISPRYQHFLISLKTFAQSLTDEEHLHFPEPSSYIKSINKIERDAVSEDNSPSSNHLRNPFDALSAEHLASDEMLRRLFEDTLPWIKEIERNSPYVLSGPRGCGKSMVFRYQAIKTHSKTAESALNAIEKFDFFGVYISCANELENDLLWMQHKPKTAREHSSSLITFFNLVLARELCRSFAEIERLPEAKEKLDLSDTAIFEMSQYILHELGEENLPQLLTYKSRLTALAEFLDRKRAEVSRHMLHGVKSDLILPIVFIRDLTRLINRLMPEFQNKRITFLLDDYTSHRLGEDVQEILNPLIWQRHSEFNFKISCEPKGFSNSSEGMTKIENLREFKELDTSNYLSSGSAYDTKKRRVFTEGLLDKRLEAAGYVAATRELIGQSPYKSDPQLANIIRNTKQGTEYYYYGLGALSSCWSGDVITILFIVERMFQKASVTPAYKGTIPKRIQHESIKSVSTALVRRIENYHPYGSRMRKFIDIWGDIARHLLSTCSNDLKSNDIPRKYRVEISIGGKGTIYQHLDYVDKSGVSSKILLQLVRRSILIEKPESTPKEKDKERTAIYQIRASLLPKYSTSFVRKNYLRVQSVEQFSKFLLCEDEIKDTLIDIETKDAEKEKANQEDLFNGL